MTQQCATLYILDYMQEEALSDKPIRLLKRTRRIQYEGVLKRTCKTFEIVDQQKRKETFAGTAPTQ
jgi:hypothetical protein